MTNIELFMEKQAEENRRVFEALKQINERLDTYEEKGDEWIAFFKHLNSNRMEEISHLRCGVAMLQKKIMEPIAQAFVDQAQAKVNKSTHTHSHFCPSCNCNTRS